MSATAVQGSADFPRAFIINHFTLFFPFHVRITTVLLYYNLSDEESQRAMGAVPFGSTEADTMANQDSVAGRAQNKHNSKGSRSE